MRFPASPSASVSRRSRAVWPSSSSARISNRPARASSATAPSSRRRPSRSLPESTPISCSMMACAALASASCATSRRSSSRSRPTVKRSMRSSSGASRSQILPLEVCVMVRVLGRWRSVRQAGKVAGGGAGGRVGHLVRAGTPLLPGPSPAAGRGVVRSISRHAAMAPSPPPAARAPPLPRGERGATWPSKVAAPGGRFHLRDPLPRPLPPQGGKGRTEPSNPSTRGGPREIVRTQARDEERPRRTVRTSQGERRSNNDAGTARAAGGRTIYRRSSDRSSEARRRIRR
jgi:hypothetical protein